jgi:hypothetical protein
MITGSRARRLSGGPSTARHTPAPRRALAARIARGIGPDKIDRVKQEHPTVDTRMVFRCMLVGLDAAAADLCKLAIRPLEGVVVPDVAEACRRMSEVLPLIVVTAAGHPRAELDELGELAGACGAEMVSVPHPPNANALGRQILEALRKGEARRVGR